MRSFGSTLVTLLPRLVRGGRAAPSARAGVQWVGNELALVRISHDGLVTHAACVPVTTDRHSTVREAIAAGWLRDTRVVLALTPGQYDVQFVAAPEVPADELREALRWQLGAALSYPPEEAVLDCTALPPAIANAGKSTLIVAAARRSAVEESIAPFFDAGLGIDAIDLPEFAQRNLARRLQVDAQASAWLGFDRDTCLLTIHLDGALAFSRRMLLPGAAVQAIDADLEPAALHFAERVVTQVQRSLELFERQSGLPPLAALTVGPHLHAARIARVVSERASLQAAVLDPAALIGPAPASARPGHLVDAAVMTALGAALRPPGRATDALAGWRSSMPRWLRRSARPPRAVSPPGAAAAAG